jgi:uncharacterized protein (TIGR00369 family)
LSIGANNWKPSRQTRIVMKEGNELEKHLALMAKNASMAGEMKLPPPIFLDMQGEFLTIDLKKRTMSIRFPVLNRYQNPLGYMQGGMIAAAIDNTTGPLAFLVAAPSVTREMSLRFRRPVTPGMSSIVVTAEVEAETDRDLVLAAEVRDENGRLLAEATATQVFTRVRSQTSGSD